MNLKTYIKPLTKAQKVAFAKRIGTNYDYLLQLSGEFRKPSPKLARAIESATNGHVTKETLRPDVYPGDKAA